MVNAVLEQPAIPIEIDADNTKLTDNTFGYSVIIKYGDEKLIDGMRNVVKRALSK